MVLDTSAVLAILLQEPEEGLFVSLIANDRIRCISSVSFVEASIVLSTRKGCAGVNKFDLFLKRASLEVIPVDMHQAELARAAYEKFGKGHHRASLNMGDCFSYALAQSTKDTLLFKGNDFAQTDVQSAAEV